MSKKFITQFNRTGLETVKEFVHPCKVVKSLRDECDLNVIFDNYCPGDKLPVTRDLVYGDMTITPQSYAEAQAIIDKVKSDFDTLPSVVRKEFDNNCMNFVTSFNKALNGDKMYLDKMTNLNILKKSVADVATSGNDLSLISRSDSKNSEISSNPAPIEGSAD